MAQPGNLAETVFEAVIVPHRSLSPRGLRTLIGALCLLSCITSSVFWMLGAWPVVGFCGAEIMLAILLLRLNVQGKRESEVVMLSTEGLRIVRTNARGARQEVVLPTAWLRLSLEEISGRVPKLTVSAKGTTVEIATSLGDAEKRNLAAALEQALHRWRHPVFDNPQLRPG